LVSQAENRGLDEMFLVSGDGDLTEAVEAAQARGVQVTLMVVEGARDGELKDVSKHLRMEADDLLLLRVEDLEPCMTPRVQAPIPAAAQPIEMPTPTPDEVKRHADKVAKHVVERWLPVATKEQLRELESRTVVPIEAYRALLRDLASAIGCSDLDDEARRMARDLFWVHVGKQLPGLGR
jgi:hypothetical protein